MRMRMIMLVVVAMTAEIAHAKIDTGSATLASAGGRGAVFPAQDGTYSGVRVVAQMRETDPTVMDIKYIVYTDTNTAPTVNVRVLAFEDGERGFATVVRPETFIEGTDANVGDGIAANVEHRLAWKVSSDWATDLAKVSFEVMAMKPGDLLLPMHFVAIPATEGHSKTVASVNDLSLYLYDIDPNGNARYNSWNPYVNNYHMVGHVPLLNALLWLYADSASDISISAGVVRNGNIELVRHAAFGYYLPRFSSLNDESNYGYAWFLGLDAIRYVFGKMGYHIPNYTELRWVNNNTRLQLSPKNFRQYAVKAIEE